MYNSEVTHGCTCSSRSIKNKCVFTTLFFLFNTFWQDFRQLIIPSVDKKDAISKLITKQHSQKIEREYFGLNALNIPTLFKVFNSVFFYRFKISVNLILFVINKPLPSLPDLVEFSLKKLFLARTQPE